jgi:hypothetical protein
MAKGRSSVDTPPVPSPAAPVGETTIGLHEIKTDPHNRRRRTTRGATMLRDALHQVGAGRSIVIDETGEVLAGSGTIEAAREVGIQKVRIIDSAGDELIAVRRSNLSGDQKRQLAMYDNRTGELAEWDADQIAHDIATGKELQPFFSDAEVRELVKSRNARIPIVKEIATGEVTDYFWISVRGPLKAQAQALHRLRTLMADLEGVTVELGTVQSVDFEPFKA